MTFLWPELLWLLVLVPLIVGLYLLLLRRKKRMAVRYASLTMVKEAIGAGNRFRVDGQCRRAQRKGMTASPVRRYDRA